MLSSGCRRPDQCTAMPKLIHETALVSPDASLADDVEVLPYSVIAGNVVIGSGTVVGPHAVVHDNVRIGCNNHIHAQAVIGDLPQDVTFVGEDTWVEIGDDNLIRECVTIHRSTNPEQPTRVGSGCFLMALCHIGHDCQVGDNVILTGYVGLAGHVVAEAGCVLGGGALIHQFTRVGTLAMIAGGTPVRKDVLPYSLLGGHPVRHRGPNSVGLRRAGIRGERYRAVKDALQALRSGDSVDAVPDTPEVAHLKGWLAAKSKRGVYGFGAESNFEL